MEWVLLSLCFWYSSWALSNIDPRRDICAEVSFRLFSGATFSIGSGNASSVLTKADDFLFKNRNKIILKITWNTIEYIYSNIKDKFI